MSAVLPLWNQVFFTSFRLDVSNCLAIGWSLHEVHDIVLLSWLLILSRFYIFFWCLTLTFSWHLYWWSGTVCFKWILQNFPETGKHLWTAGLFIFFVAFVRRLKTWVNMLIKFMETFTSRFDLKHLLLSVKLSMAIHPKMLWCN